MCNIAIVVKQKVNNTGALAWLVNTSAIGWQNNHDAEGVFFDGGELVIKSEQKLDLNKYKAAFRDSEFVIAHERQSTSGHGIEFAHPFLSERFVMAHNGIFSIVPNMRTDESDTSAFFRLFCVEFDKTKSVSSALENALNACAGFWSLVIFDKKERVLYYTKNSYTTIHAYGFEKTVFLSTCTSNAFFNAEAIEYELLDNTLYAVSLTGENATPEFLCCGKLDIKENFAFANAGVNCYGDSDVYNYANYWKRNKYPYLLKSEIETEREQLEY